MSDNPAVLVLMGSDSDLPVMEGCISMLKHFAIPYDVEICSAHRTPDRAAALSQGARERGVKVIIAGAGGAAHLAGVLAAHTTLPVIGVPCPSPLNALDSLLSTVQMPAGIPVATVAIGNAGATNAGILAAQILSLSDDTIAQKLDDFKAKMKQTVADKNEKMRQNK